VGRVDEKSDDGVLLSEEEDERDLPDGTPCGAECDSFVVHGTRDDGVGEQECEDEYYVPGDKVDPAERGWVKEDPSFEDEGLRV